jgi:CRP-like cAMP-binding protein
MTVMPGEYIFRQVRGSASCIYTSGGLMKYCYYLLQGDKPDKVYFIVEGNITIIKEISIAVRNRCGDVCTVNAIGLMIAPFSMDALYYLFYSNPCCFCRLTGGQRVNQSGT